MTHLSPNNPANLPSNALFPKNYDHIRVHIEHLKKL